MKSTFLILLILSFSCSQGQPVIYPLNYNITNKIDQIQKNEFDSVFSYISVYSYPSWGEDLKGIGTIIPRGEAILLGFKNNRVSCIKLFDGPDSVFRSRPIDLKLDPILQSLRKNVPGFELEAIAPYIYACLDTIRDIKSFYSVGTHGHAPFCSLYFKCITNSSSNEFDPESLKEKYENSNRYPPNVNFKYNSSLKSYKLYSFLIVLLAKYENQFDFGK